MPSHTPVRPAHASWLVLPQVANAVERTLRKRGVRGADIEDHRQAVLVSAYVTAQVPATLPECIALVEKMARDRAIDAYRKSKRRSKVDTGLCEDPDERPPVDDAGEGEEAIDARQQLAFLRKEIASGAITERQVAILVSAADEVPQLQIAANMNLAHSTVRNELAAARRSVRTRWALYAAAVLAAFGIFIWYQNQPDRVARPPGPAPKPDESVSPQQDTPLQAAQDKRQRALHDCDLQAWDACLRGLDEARALDPVGDRDARVRSARVEAKRQIDERDKPFDHNP